MSEQEKPKVIETASATTSSEDNQSGPFAYVITAVVVVAVVLCALIGGGCTAAIVATSSAWDELSSTRGGYSGTLPYDLEDIEDIDDVDDILDWYVNDQNRTISDSPNAKDTSNSRSCTLDEALEFDLAPYTLYIDSYVSASAYAGSSTGAYEFVREVISTDSEYFQEVMSALNDAARADGKEHEHLTEAIEACDKAKEAINAIALPASTGEGTVNDALGTAKTQSADRWDAVKRELEFLDTDQEIRKSDLWDLDDDVVKATEKAGELLTEALETSASENSD